MARPKASGDCRRGNMEALKGEKGAEENEKEDRKRHARETRP